MSRDSSTANILCSVIAVVIAGAALTRASNANAANFRTYYVTATAACSGPLPAYDGALRRSPLGIRNQGNENVFISCSLPADYVGDMTSGTVQPSFHNFGVIPATVKCTMVAGMREYGFGSVAATTSVAASGDNQISWFSIDKHDIFGSYNFSCILPPNVEINTIIYQNNDADNGL